MINRACIEQKMRYKHLKKEKYLTKNIIKKKSSKILNYNKTENLKIFFLYKSLIKIGLVNLEIFCYRYPNRQTAESVFFCNFLT